MKTNHTQNNADAATDRDTFIGKALSSALAKTSSCEPCPSSEELASLKDGSLETSKRDRLLGHMAVCDRCRDIYLLTHSLSQEAPVSQPRRSWYAAGGALAIAVTVLLVIKMTTPTAPEKSPQAASVQTPQMAQAPATPKPENISKAEESSQQKAKDPGATFNVATAARMLAKSITSDNLASVAGAPSKTYGFAGSSRQANVFKAGQELFELELWLAAGDKERAELTTVRLTPLIKSIGGDAATAPLNELLRQLETNTPVKRRDDISAQLEARLAVADRGIARLGSWAAAARVATGMGKDPYFGGNPPGALLTELGKAVPPETRKSLEKLAKQKPASDTALLRQLLDELANTL